MERIARELGLDPLEFRLKNVVRAGEEHPMSQGVERRPRGARRDDPHERDCRVRAAGGGVDWMGDRETGDRETGDWNDSRYSPIRQLPALRRGKGVALVMQGTAIPNLDMGAASIKMNDDGSFNLLVGATDLGTGSDTVLAQMAAEVLGCPLDDFIIYSSDTDFTPFDKGAYASSTTYISGAAVVEAARQGGRADQGGGRADARRAAG